MKNKSLSIQSIRKLIKWYQNQSLGLMPWRNTSDPYKIWLSEVMLQQTQVKTVIPYYNRWIKKLPTLHSVAKAHQKTILKLWEGLGYYQRVINFHLSCKLICSKLNGSIPSNPNDFIQLRGVGDYTCAAVQSIAFNHKVICVDGNVHRIMSRVLCLDTKNKTNNSRMRFLLNQWIQDFIPADFNQAMMDLGRNVCTPTKPACSLCPLQPICKAYVEHKISSYPIKKIKKKLPVVHASIGIIWKENRFLICKRQNTSFLGGLWELPGGKVKKNETPQDCLEREIYEEVGLKVKINGKRFALVNHKYSHFHAKINVFNCIILSSKDYTFRPASMKWIFPHQIKKYPFPKANHKFFDKIK